MEDEPIIYIVLFVLAILIAIVIFWPSGGDDE